MLTQSKEQATLKTRQQCKHEPRKQQATRFEENIMGKSHMDVQYSVGGVRNTIVLKASLGLALGHCALQDRSKSWHLKVLLHTFPRLLLTQSPLNLLKLGLFPLLGIGNIVKIFAPGVWNSLSSQ